MINAQRIAIYLRGRRDLTPRQRRRVIKKARKGK